MVGWPEPAATRTIQVDVKICPAYLVRYSDVPAAATYISQMSKLWGGRFTGKTDPVMERFNNSLPVDRVMWNVDIDGSIAKLRRTIRERRPLPHRKPLRHIQLASTTRSEKTRRTHTET